MLCLSIRMYVHLSVLNQKIWLSIFVPKTEQADDIIQLFYDMQFYKNPLAGFAPNLWGDKPKNIRRTCEPDISARGFF